MHIRDEDFELYLLERLDAEMKAAIEGHLRQCVACAIRVTSVNILRESSRAQAMAGGKDKRREQRIPTEGAGVLQRINPFSIDRLDIRILDVSSEGMRIGSPYPLDPGTTVKLRLSTVIAFGEVRHCRLVSGAYQAGIHLHDALQL
jgi:hypothetical protein